MRNGLSCGSLLSGLMVALVAAFFVSTATPSYAAEKMASKDIVLKDDAQCTRCHDEEDSPGILTIGKTKHGTRADGRTPTCTTCHGASESHINKPANVSKRPEPDRMFGKKSATAAADRTGVCLTCHSGKERTFWASGAHASQDLSCDTCHQVHNNGHDKVREKRTQAEVCFSCHKSQRIQATRPSHHPVIEGKVTCSDCHNPHGSAGEKNLARDTVNDTCFKCHAEKRGPFLWNHQPVTENCGLCHDPHGTTTANLLRLRPPFLCQQCHEGQSHRGAVPTVTEAVTGESGSMVLMARGCVNCHTNIHGSNHGQNTSGSRSMRQ